MVSCSTTFSFPKTQTRAKQQIGTERFGKGNLGKGQLQFLCAHRRRSAMLETMWIPRACCFSLENLACLREPVPLLSKQGSTCVLVLSHHHYCWDLALHKIKRLINVSWGLVGPSARHQCPQQGSWQPSRKRHSYLGWAAVWCGFAL